MHLNTPQLRQTPLIDGVEGDDLEQISRLMSVDSFNQDDVILQEGVSSRNVWILIQGKCLVVKAPSSRKSAVPITLAELSPYETFGEMTMFSESPHVASVRANGNVRTIKLSREDFDQLHRARPDLACRLACNMLNIISARLRRMDNWIEEILVQHDEPNMLDEQWKMIQEKLNNNGPGHLV